MKLDEMTLMSHPFGYQYRTLFPNGWGISAIPEKDIGEEEMFEVGVLKWHKLNGEEIIRLCYDSPLTNDVIRYVMADGVEAIADQVSKLPPRVTEIEVFECSATATQLGRENEDVTE